MTPSRSLTSSCPVSITTGVGVGGSGTVAVATPGVIVAVDEVPGALVTVGPGTIVVGRGVIVADASVVGVVGNDDSVGVGGIGAIAVGARSDARGVGVGVGALESLLPPQPTVTNPRSISTPTKTTRCPGFRRSMRIVLSALNLDPT